MTEDATDRRALEQAFGHMPRSQVEFLLDIARYEHVGKGARASRCEEMMNMMLVPAAARALRRMARDALPLTPDREPPA